MSVPAGPILGMTIGALAIYCGLTDTTPLTALRAFMSGSLPPVSSFAPTVTNASTATASDVQAVQTNIYSTVIPGVSSIGAMIVAAAQQFAGDQYSESKRNQTGYSDCSSFVSKCLIAAGIAHPCGWSGGNYPTTVSYATWSALEGVHDGSVQPGDILLIPGVHMALVVDANTAIGQENPSVNVQQGSWKNIMLEPAGIPAYGQYRINLAAA